MFSFFRRKPKFIDPALADLAQMLTEEADAPTYRRELLDRSRLDFSLTSLRHLEDYLDALRAQRPENDQDYFRATLRCGAYLGEVIRRNSRKDWHWLDYDSAAKHLSILKEQGPSLGASVVLWCAPADCCFPVGRIMKYLDNGNEDSVVFYAEVLAKDMLAGQD